MISPVPDFFVWGISHKNAPLALREKCVLDPQGEAALCAILGECRLSEWVLLHTCNRVEIYGIGKIAPEVLAARFAELRGLPAPDLENVFYHAYGAKALSHLMCVAAGIESQMVGETEIFGQVKDAYAKAAAQGFTGALLNRLFQKTFQAVKDARSNSGVSRGQVSVGNVAVELGERIFGDMAQARVLVLGAGEVGEKTLQAMRSRGAEKITLASRTLEHARETAERCGGAFVLSLDEALAGLYRYDVVVASLAASEGILNGTLIQWALAKRKFEPMFFIDLALPRNVASIKGISDAYLYDLDDLSRIANENLRQRLAEVESCRRMLAEKAIKVWQSLCQRC